MKIKQLRGKNLLLKIDKPATLKEKKGIIINPGKTAHIVAEVIDIGHKSDEGFEIGDKVLISAQSIDFDITNPDLPEYADDRSADYFLIFDEQVIAVLERTEEDEKAELKAKEDQDALKAKRSNLII